MNRKAFVLILIFSLYFTACSKPVSTVKSEKPEFSAQSIRAIPGRNLKDYQFNPESKLISRIKINPDAALDYFRQLDSNPNYSLYQPSQEERQLMLDSFTQLPPLTQKVLKERLAGIYFVNHLLGSGLTEFILNDQDEIYIIMAFNPAIFKKNINQWLTDKENTCFIPNKEGLRLEIEVNPKLSGFFGILLHESVHAVDYVVGITPFVEPALQKIRKPLTKKSDFILGIWQEYQIPDKSADFLWRPKLTFYGSKNGPLILLEKAPEVYAQLLASPFVSLYSTLLWAEDLAEFVMFYHLTQKMRNPYRIQIKNAGKILSSYEPMLSKQVKDRFKTVEIFYHK